MALKRPLRVLAGSVHKGRIAGSSGYREPGWSMGNCQAPPLHFSPAPVSDSANRRTFGSVLEILLAPVEQFTQRRSVESVPAPEICLGRKSGITIPRAYQLTIVTAIDAVAHGLAELKRNRACKLDGQVGNTASGIQLPGGHNSLRRADVDTRGATATMRAYWRVDR